MYNAKLAAIKAAANASAELDAANAENRGYEVAIADFYAIGVPKYKGTQTMVCLGTKDHPHLMPINPEYQFDNRELDRLITVAINREWTRAEHQPRRGILLMGPTGSGKTTYIRQRLAMQGIPCAEFDWKPRMESSEALFTKQLMDGDIITTPSIITQAALGGYPVVINELNVGNPAEVVGLNEVIDSGIIVNHETGEVYHAKRGFSIFATCNGQFVEDRDGIYAGVRAQNASTLDRFWKMELNYPESDVVKAFVAKVAPDFTKEMVEGVAKFVGMVRKAADPNSGGLQVDNATKFLSLPFSRRKVVDWLELAASFAYMQKTHNTAPLYYALGPAYTNGLPDDEVATIKHIYDIALGVENA